MGEESGYQTFGYDCDCNRIIHILENLEHCRHFEEGWCKKYNEECSALPIYLEGEGIE